MKVSKNSEDEPQTQDIDCTQLGACFPSKRSENVVLRCARTGGSPQCKTKSWDRVPRRGTNWSPAQKRTSPRTRSPEEYFKEMKEGTGDGKSERAQCVCPRTITREEHCHVKSQANFSRGSQSRIPKNLPFTYISVQQPLRPPLLQPNGKSNNQC